MPERGGSTFGQGAIGPDSAAIVPGALGCQGGPRCSLSPCAATPGVAGTAGMTMIRAMPFPWRAPAVVGIGEV